MPIRRTIRSLIVSILLLWSIVMSATTASAAAAATSSPNSSCKPTVLIVGFGDLGERLVKLLQDDFQFVGLRRNPSKLPAGVVGISADYTDKDSLLAGLRSCETEHQLPFRYIVVTQTPSGGFNEESYQKHYPKATQNLLDALAELEPSQPPRRILYVSSISVYDSSDKPITEDSPTNPPRFNGRAVLEAETLLQKQSSIPVSILRMAGLYGGNSDPDGPKDDIRPSLTDHALARAAAASIQNDKPLSPLVAPEGGPSKLHRDDAASALAHVLRRCEDVGNTVHHRYVVADAAPATNRQVAEWIAERAAKTGVEVPGLRKLYLQPTSGPSKFWGKQCDSSLLQSEGWELKYPSFREGYIEVYGE